MSSTEAQRADAVLAAAESWPGVRDGETMRSVALPGMTLSIRRRAAARDELEPALFVHGLGGSSRNWSALMQRLSGTVECEAVDLPGFGASPPTDRRDYSISGHARAVVRCLEASARGPVHLMGNSLGGAVATRVAALRPDLVRSLTLVSPALPHWRPQRTALPTALLGVPGASWLLRRAAGDYPPEQRARGVLRLCYGDPARITPEEFSGAVAELERREALPYFWESLTASTRGLLNAFSVGGQQSLWRQAERVLVPTLLIYGGRDRLISFRMARRASAAFRNSRLVTLPDAGHVAMMEFPDAVADAFRDFLDHHASSTPDRPARADDSGGG
ncbi:alpha/beta fold hydrolase [Streptomyces aidingensis]|uniref:Pimeloyl-ACP methyl ester carboxylesterase n=1 Tax=Streptomyces aidingensis TaxID=910347 RepID=A0A1I1EXA7_9ACTN|nr:alpha/beta hydrolase [Streptomyces aidingensis]SFB91292.1 Pimeloyl-ACP methyl ester carboxylesterase [Streptomyces aidingensis]